MQHNALPSTEAAGRAPRAASRGPVGSGRVRGDPGRGREGKGERLGVRLRTADGLAV